MKLSLKDLIEIANEGYSEGLVAEAFDTGTSGDHLAEFIAQELEDTFDRKANSEDQIYEALSAINDARCQLDSVEVALKQIDHILHETYQDVLDYYREDTCSNPAVVDRFLLKRIKDKDLPLFINYPWSREVKQTFLTRLKGE